MKFQVVLSTGGIFETIIFCRDTSYYLSIDHYLFDNQFVSIMNNTGLDWYSKRGGKNAGLNLSFISKIARVVF